MDSAALLDLLGNENRRRILRLLARKPCYVTEISDYLGVSPKAVIDHLRKLEEAGLVESRVDENRRKYFHIASNVRLEVNVSPYAFGTKSAYPASASLDLTTCRHLTVDVQYDDGRESVSGLANELDRLRELENELSLAQRWVQGRITDVHDRLSEQIDGDSRFYADVLAAIGRGSVTVDELCATLDAPEPVVVDALDALVDEGFVHENDDEWELVG